MVKSMTGYGTSTFQFENTSITIEIRSINHRFLDIIPKYPKTFLYLEDKIKKRVKSFFQRGRIELHIEIEGTNFVNKTIVTDWELLDQLVQQIKTAQDRYKLSEDIPVSLLTSLPDIITVQENEEKPSGLQERLLQCLDEACEQVLLMRIDEGKYLLKDILERVSAIRNMISLLEGRREVVIQEYRLRIQERISNFVDGSINLEEGRIYQEIAILAEKGDITEEITRLHSHIEQITDLCNSNEPIGRKLDFIIQEMNREVNTIGSKSTDTKIGELTVALKSEMEKIKEQVQNIE
ncbi:YicC/YloC family endoribonuclease [Ornithinibacillus scapharcae]|uniref:YicC/YloC family endoribonuclease n=1 Tax=Ornithinibacillus scapharcae TaxID=1147159 RepID=UPI000225BE15|nr:YicC/YloC family endoribonuclease [Ornithinibacillus scapharcae]